MTRASGGYPAIADHGAIGNLRTVALVALDGTIDWCCLPALSSPSAFGSLLDRRRGGHFRVAPARYSRSRQQYRGDTCILETTFEGEHGALVVTDFMPLRGTIIGANDPDTEPSIYRVLHCLGGEVEVEVEWAPRFDYARTVPRIHRLDGGFLAESEAERMVLGGVPTADAAVEDGGEGPVLRGRFRMRAGERRVLVARYAADDREHAPREVHPGVTLEDAVQRLRETAETWGAWAHDNEERPTQDWAGEWSSLVTRSELTLKMLTHPDTGAIAAAATTSLPEDVGGVRNWDYRYSWVRDSSFVVQALHSLGHSAEAYDYLEFLQRACRQGADGEWEGALQIMYGLHGETDLGEKELDHLEGYRGSRPVRIGNAAAGQRQHDTYGELMDSAFELVRRGETLKDADWDFLCQVADAACRGWRRPDSGIWEMRGPELHFVHSKVMLWVAFDRAVRLAECGELTGDVAGWREIRDVLCELVLRRGYNRELGSFVQSFGSDAIDASALRFPVQEFIAADDPRMLGTIDRVLERLTENGLVYRYRVDDALPGGEGAFGLCTFWLVDALTLAGRTDEALGIFEGMMARANHVGLYSEQIDPRTGEFLGNFPQAFTHLGVVNSMLYLARAQGRPLPAHARLVGAGDGGSPRETEQRE